MSAPSPIPFLDLALETRALRPDLDRAVARVLDRGRFLLGPELDAFEQELSAWLGGGTVCGTSNGLDAIELLLRAHGIGPGDEVLVPSNTYIATWLGVTHAGAVPVPVEPDPDTRNLGAHGLEQALTPRTRAVLGVHLYGSPCDLAALSTFCRRHHLPLLIDAAQALGATWEGSRTRALADGAALSFYPTKNLGACGDAGAVWTPDPAIATTIRLLRNYGMKSRDEHGLVGRNCRLDELQAALLRAKLPHLETGNTRRTTLARRYRTNLANLPSLNLPPDIPGSVWHLFVVGVDDRDRVARDLETRGIGTSVHYPVPPHLSGAYRDTVRTPQPVAETWSRRALSLPLHPWLTDAEIDTVASTLRDIVSR
jgi:dTDP-3-amino-3,4,6-trideoxy-alpha-D-glucose transaminase